MANNYKKTVISEYSNWTYKFTAGETACTRRVKAQADPPPARRGQKDPPTARREQEVPPPARRGQEVPPTAG